MAYSWYVKQSVIDALKAGGAIGLERIYIKTTDNNILNSGNISADSFIEFSGGKKSYLDGASVIGLLSGAGDALESPVTVPAAFGVEGLTFAESGKTITRETSNWPAGFTTGVSIVIAGSSYNDGLFTIDTVAGKILTVVESLSDETIVDASTTVINANPFMLVLSGSVSGALLFFNNANVAAGYLKVAYKHPDASSNLPQLIAQIPMASIDAVFTGVQGGAANSLPNHGRWKVISSMISAIASGGCTGLTEIQLETSDGNPPTAQIIATVANDVAGSLNGTDTDLVMTTGTWPEWLTVSGKNISFRSADGTTITEGGTTVNLSDDRKTLTVSGDITSWVWDQVVYVSGVFPYNLVAGDEAGSGSYLKIGGTEYPYGNGSLLSPITDVSGLKLADNGMLLMGHPTLASSLMITESFCLARAGTVAEVTDITCAADVSKSLNEEYFRLYAPDIEFHVWFNVDSTGVEPSIPNSTPIEIAITENATASQVAAAVQLAVDARSEFSATVDGAVVTVTNTYIGDNPTDADQGSLEEFTVTVTTQGAFTQGFANCLPVDRVFTDVNLGPVAPAVPANVVLVGTKVVGEVEVDPTVAPGATYNDLPLPAGSVLRNTVTGIKYIAGGASATDFAAIPLTPDVDWSWAAGADDAWAILQAK